jgi:iron complex outermembrane receptor protein
LLLRSLHWPSGTTTFAQLEEVLVTAQKRQQSLQEVPIAISAVSGELLEQTGVNTITEIIPMVPGLSGARLRVSHQ